MSKLNKANSKRKLFDVHAPVFWPAVILLTLFISVTLVVGAPMKEFFADVQNAISEYFGGFMILSINFFLIFCLYMAFGRFGHVRLGGKNAKPEFSTSAWFAMLFGAGMGIGLMFWSVAEPMFNYVTPAKPGVVTPETIEAYAEGMKYVFLHWGFHPWAVYALVGMALAYFTFNRRLPLAVRSVFYPILGERIHGRIGDLIDILAVLATLFGLASSLGLGVQQIGAGFEYLFGIKNTTEVQMLVIGAVTLAATVSVVTGLDKGVKMLSELNLYLAGLFLLFVLVVGPTMFIFDGFIENLGNYVGNFIELSFWTESYVNGKFSESHVDWQNGWTLMYDAWWIAWSPFVGIFIARISKGRTIREFVLGVLFVPSLVTFFWISAFGGTAIFYELTGVDISNTIMEDVSTSLYFLMEQLPLSEISSVISIILVISFFVTSSDSGSLVVDSITSGGKLDAPVGQRIFWALTEGLVAAMLLYGGGLQAIQAAVITTGLPFTIVLIFMAFSLRKSLKDEAEAKSDISDYERRIIEMARQRKQKKKTKEDGSALENEVKI
ncbi:BCCT family transporter [Sediminitomix flava]|uniref:Choline/glycine/proline betaine transport protein n=1 Tax=Sediminitomix flava TaxID=379075 RepID=A0A315Z4M1_SEDFL|nr:BCCT family transporter [Sediminitomix flava]PWJ38423.1 choline/glycine/proline betaine transport protein [Sediminitomix flava]